MREILAANLSRLMEHDDFKTFDKAAKRAEVGRGTIERAKKGQTGLSVDNLAKIALAMGLEPWQLLVEGLDPNNPPMLAEVSQKQMELFKRFKEAAKELSDE